MAGRKTTKATAAKQATTRKTPRTKSSQTKRATTRAKATAKKSKAKTPAKKMSQIDAPHATLYASILREINTKKKDARFKKTERGHFTLSARK